MLELTGILIWTTRMRAELETPVILGTCSRVGQICCFQDHWQPSQQWFYWSSFIYQTISGTWPQWPSYYGKCGSWATIARRSQNVQLVHTQPGQAQAASESPKPADSPGEQPEDAVPPPVPVPGTAFATTPSRQSRPAAGYFSLVQWH